MAQFRKTKGDTAITDLLVIAGILIFSLVLVAAGIALITNIVMSTKLSAAEDAARDIASIIAKLNSTTASNIEYIYVMPKPQTATTSKFNVEIKESLVSVKIGIIALSGEEKTRIGTERLPNIEIDSKCKDVRALRIFKSNGIPGVQYCQKAYSIYVESQVRTECAGFWINGNGGTCI